MTENPTPLFQVHKGHPGDDDLAALTVVLCALAAERGTAVPRNAPAAWATSAFRAAHSWRAGQGEQSNPAP